MMKKTFLLTVFVLFVACDDGNIVIENLLFNTTSVDDTCGEFILYKIAENKTDVLVLELNNDGVFGGVETQTDTVIFNIDNKTNKVLYRIFDNEVDASYFCQDIPPTSPRVLEEWSAPSGTVQIITTLTEDDEDGIVAIDEGAIFNSNGSINKDLSRDSDGDGIPDFIDRDDDNDNVFTYEEIHIENGVVTLIDTDGDSIPDYLDPDDDNDGVLTIDEDLNGDGNPANDVASGSLIPNYLTSITAVAVSDTIPVKDNQYLQKYTSEIRFIDGFQLENENEEIKFSAEEYFFGTYEVSEIK